MITDKVTTTRGDVISMVSCRHDYGHANQIADEFFWSLLGESLSDQEIEEFVRDFESDEDYTEKDCEDILKDVKEWRDERVGDHS